jgi:ELWxxDGT repeat protein
MAGGALAQAPYRIADVNTHGASASIGEVAVTPTAAFFTATTPQYGAEPYYSTGASQAALLLDLTPGPASSALYSVLEGGPTAAAFFISANQVRRLTTPPVFYAILGADNSTKVPAETFYKLLTVNGTGYLVSNTGGASHSSLWTTNGQLTNSTGHVIQAVGLGTSLLFLSTPYGTTQGPLNEVWTSNGTNAGTMKLFSAANAYALTPGLTRAYYEVGPYLYSTDGVSLTPALVSTAAQFGQVGGATLGVTLGDVLVGGCTTPATGWELCRSDGTPGGTYVVKDLYPGATGAFAGSFVKAGSKVFFVATTPTSTASLFVTDGTAAGTQVLLDLTASGLSMRQMAGSATRLVFSVDTGTAYQVWSSDGTPGGTALMATYLHTLVPIFSVHPSNPLAYFKADTMAFGPELYVTDGTVVGTHVVQDIATGTGPSNPRAFLATADLSRGYFGTDQGVYVTSGAALDASPVSTGVGYPLVTIGTRVLMAATAPATGYELYLGDRSVPQLLLKDLNPGVNSGAYRSVPDGVELGGKAYFPAGPAKLQLWSSDGTASGTSLVLDPDPFGNASTNTLVRVGTHFFFNAWTTGEGNELWVSDGTAAGTHLVTDLNPGTASSFPQGHLPFKNGLLFMAVVGANRGLYFTDGTAAGTALVSNIGVNGNNACTLLGEDVAFVGGFSPTSGLYRVYRTDGTAAGTTLISLGAQTYVNSPIACLGDRALIAAYNSGAGKYVPMTADTLSATATALDAGFNAYPTMAAVGTSAFFGASLVGLDAGTELIKTNGTTVALVADLAPGAMSSNPSNFARVNDRLVFSAADDSWDFEPWGLQLDSTPPVITPSLNGDAGSNGWFITPVSLSFAVTEPNSRLVTHGCAAQNFTADTAGTTVTCLALSEGGRTESSVVVKVDTVPPVAPVVTAPVGAVPTATPTVQGTVAEAGTVVVSSGSTVVCTTTVAAAGAFSCVLSASLPQGAASLTVRLFDVAGNPSPTTGVAFTVDTVAPPEPAVVSPAANGVVNSFAPSGTAEPLSTVKVTLDGATTVACTATASATGQWSCAALAVTDAAHTASATATDAAGNVSAATTVSFTVDSVAPATPNLTAPAASALVPGTVPFTGNAEPSSTVTVSVDGQASLGCTASVALDGSWSCTPAVALTSGAHSAAARAADAAGNQSASSTPVAFTVDASIPGVPTVTAPSAGQQLANDLPTFQGAAQTGLSVAVTVDGAAAPSCTSLAAAGAWVCTASAPLAQGAHTVSAVAQNQVGASSAASAPVSFTIDSVAPPAPVVTAPAAGATTGEWPALAGTAEALSTVRVFFDGDAASDCTSVTSAAGAFACAPVSALGQGLHTLTATATDGAGNVSSPSGALSFTVKSSVDTTAPVLTCPPDLTLEALSTGYAPAGFAATATDDVDASPQVSYSQAPGSDFPVGTTEVTAQAADSSGNKATCSFNVVVTASTQKSKPAGGCRCSSAAPDSSFVALAVMMLSLGARRRRAQ